MSGFSWAADASARAIMEMTALVKASENIWWEGICPKVGTIVFPLGLSYSGARGRIEDEFTSAIDVSLCRCLYKGAFSESDLFRVC